MTSFWGRDIEKICVGQTTSFCPWYLKKKGLFIVVLHETMVKSHFAPESLSNPLCSLTKVWCFKLPPTVNSIQNTIKIDDVAEAFW